MKSIGEINFHGYWGGSDEPQGWAGLDDCEKNAYTSTAKAVLAHAAAIIRERAETETTTWAARDEWRRVALLLESLE